MNNMEFIDGMNKAWDLAFRLIGEDEDILLKIFGTAEVDEIISNNEPQYVLKKLEEYDNENRKEYLPDTNVGNKDGWILCSERLPEEYGEYLCCDNYSNYIIGYPTKRVAYDEYYVETECEIMEDCIAWQPLPEPYKQEGE